MSFYPSSDLGLALAVMLASTARRRSTFIPSEAVINEAHEMAIREDWNRNVEAKRARKAQIKRNGGRR